MERDCTIGLRTMSLFSLLHADSIYPVFPLCGASERASESSVFVTSSSRFPHWQYVDCAFSIFTLLEHRLSFLLRGYQLPMREALQRRGLGGL